MEDVQGGRAPAWFRVLAMIGLVWSLLGLAMLLAHFGAFGDMTAAMTDAERALEESTPDWVIGAFAVAVVSAVLGSLGLVLQKAWARLLLYLSLAAVLVQHGWTVFVSDAILVHGAIGWLLPFVIVDVAIMLAILASVGASRGWLR